ncbi:hypothetical protein GSI_00012 [Ganoderma sinense ZZ0214-1]|uniref:C2H2-type domain-containing protein n=1 Tax=Ganoderma sinense ZZ0214-1 TaxID=1077348 RepID=A0A2G8SRE8_9APHY|nr:hypothetical protein GSI_00012 [Ganoderma sinense ZZ0214-1]
MSSSSISQNHPPGFCPGCETQFTRVGLPRHLRQTQKPECIAICKAQEALLTADTARDNSLLNPDSAISPPFEDVDMESSPIPFEGDFFGDYTPDFFDPVLHGHPRSPPASDSDTDSDSESDDDEPDVQSWEPAPRIDPLVDAAHVSDGSASSESNGCSPEDISSAAAAAEGRRVIEVNTTRKTFIVRYPSKHAGAPIPKAKSIASSNESYRSQLNPNGSSSDNPYAPFDSKLDWEIAQWAKLRGPGSTVFTDLLAIEEVAKLLALSYKDSRGLNKIIDQKLPSARPRFQRHEIVVAGEAFEVFYRDVLECIKALFGDPEFTPLLLLAPERHYADVDETVQVYFDMHTGKWWWATQKELEKQRPGATVLPIIISSDKTQLTLIGNKTAYPVYMTLGNLPKDVRCKPSRRGQILLAYLSTSRLLHITNKAAQRRTLANLFHACMSCVLAPLRSAGVTGIQIARGDGVLFRGHPILVVYVGDYPEQLLVTGCKTGECPKCPIPRSEVGNDTDSDRALRDLEKVLDAIAAVGDGPRAFTKACAEAGIKPIVSPFWSELPYANIYLAITPDILHQLYQGVMKHLIAWLQEAYGEDEIDARFRRLPMNHNLRHFAKGISCMSRVTGKEHADICRVLLGVIIGLPLPGGASPVRLIRATRALLHFLYLAQYPTHTSETLVLLDQALEDFHANKDVFVDLGIRTHFQLPKLHSLDHYRRSIELFGTTDNYDTQYSERLHIDFTKDAYRASNRKDELSQMTVWLERKEKILHHEKFIQWRLQLLASQNQPDRATAITAVPLHFTGEPVHPSLATQAAAGSSPANTDGPRHDVTAPATLSGPRASQSMALSLSTGPSSGTASDKILPRIRMTRHPSAKSVTFTRLVGEYGATFFRDALARFVVSRNQPQLTHAQVERQLGTVFFPFASVPTYHKIKFRVADPQSVSAPGTEVQDVVHARPARLNKYGSLLPGQFDTALVRIDSARSDIQRFRVAQVRAIFTLPLKVIPQLFPGLT